MYEAAVEMARSLIRETNAKGEKILRLRAEVRELREKVEELRYNPYHDPTNGRFTSPNGGNGGTLYVGKGQAGNGTYILENEIDDEEYGKWLNNKIQTARAGRLQALVQNGRKAVEGNPDIGKPKRDVAIKSIEKKADTKKNVLSEPKILSETATAQTSKDIVLKSGNVIKFEEFKKKSVEHHKKRIEKMQSEKDSIEKAYSSGSISKQKYEAWKGAYNYSLKVLQDLSNRAMPNNIFAGKIVAVDFDGTIAHTAYPKILSPVYETIEFLWKAKSDGAIIILWTCREGEALKQAVEWCEKTGVPIDYVNENAPERAAKYGNNSRKISADIYIDDRAVGIADIVEYENAEELRFNPNHDPKNGRFTSGSGGGSGVNKVGKIDIRKYKCITSDIVTDEVIITDERISHIKERHNNDYELLYPLFQETLASPDYILEDSQRKNTGLILKHYTKKDVRVQIVLRIQTSSDESGFKNSIISAWKISDTRWENYIKNKKVLYKSE